MARRAPTPGFRSRTAPGAAGPRVPGVVGAAVFGACLGLAVTLLVFAPARWLTEGIASATGRQLILDAPRGTVWNGSAQLVLTGGSGSTDAAALPERIEWQLRPRWNGLRLQVVSACCTPQPLEVAVDLGWRSMQLTVADGGSAWPATLLSGLGTPFNTLRPEGTLALRTSGLAVQVADGRMRMSGRADIDIQNMASSVSQLRPLGSYRLSLQGGDVPQLSLSTLDGPLRLSGNGSWVGNRLRFVGEATALPEREAALSVLLNLLGRRVGARSVITLG